MSVNLSNCIVGSFSELIFEECDKEMLTDKSVSSQWIREGWRPRAVGILGYEVSHCLALCNFTA